MAQFLTRRDVLTQSGLVAGTLAAGLSSGISAVAQADPKPTSSLEKFRYCLNTSTIRGQKLPITEVVDIAGKAGYQGLEPWINELNAYVESGGKLSDLRKRIADNGLTVESAIGFAPWLVDDAAARTAGLEQAKRDMDMIKQIGGTRIAAPPAGATNVESLDLFVAAQRYKALLEVGDSIGVVPEIEFWGSVKSLYRLAQVVFIAVECGHPKACLLPDVYHMYRGGSDFNGLKLLDGRAVPVMHVNDYPGDIPREKQTDADRVYPGDGVAPLAQIFQDLAVAGFDGFLSLELFNRDYWQQDPLEVARTGLEKTQQAVAKSFS